MKKLILFSLLFISVTLNAQWEQENIYIQSGSISKFHFINSDTAIAVSSPFTQMDSISFIYKRYYDLNSWKWKIIDTVHLGIGGFQYLNDSLAFYASGNCCLYKSNDGLNSWNLSGSNIYDEFQELYFFNKDTGIIVGNYINITNDGGQNWNRYNSPIHYTKGKMHFVNENVGYAIVGGIYKIINTGDSIIQLTNNYISDFYDINEIYFVDENHGFILGQDGFISETFDGGNSWNIDSISDYNLTTMFFLNDTLGFMGGTGSGTYDYFLFYTFDGGQTWTKTYAPSTITEIYAHDTSALFIGSRISLIYKLDNPLNYLTTSIEHLSGFDKIKVYPNPAKDYIQINTDLINPSELEIYDISGKLILKKEIDNNSRINIKDYYPGLYIYKIKSGDELVTGKFIKI